MPRFLSLVAVALALARPLALGFPRGVHRSRVLLGADEVDESYDYVVVGGGTAGLTVADRLTEDGETTVLVIENGEFSDSPNILRVQGGGGGLNPQFLYDINSVPQTHLRGRRAPVLVGNVVGGSSAVNGMMTVRGTAEDYNRWAQFFGNGTGPGSEWSWEGLLPYFKKALHFVPPPADVARSSNISYDADFWGRESGVYAGWPSYQFPDTAALYEAFREIPGVRFPADSGAGEAGVYWYPTFMDPYNVTRSYSRTGHWDGLNRSNYHLLTGSRVNRVVLNGTTATGVRFVPANRRHGAGNSTTNSTTETPEPRSVRARREVILAAGAIHTPQILQLSGIGPKKLLAQANISTVVDLPGVGENFQDHAMLSIQVTYRNFTIHPSSGDMFNNATLRDWASEQWSKNKTGPYSIASGNAAAWLPFPVVSPGRFEELAASLAAQDAADQLEPGTDATVVAGYGAQMRSYAAALRSHGTAFYNSVIHGGFGGGNFVHLHPLSRGSVRVDPSDPEAEPVVDYRALSNPLDSALVVEMLRFTRRLYFNNTVNARFAPVETRPGDYVVSEPDLAGFAAEALTPTEFHPVGTAALLPRELGGVVDPRLAVYGTHRLRVVDGSIMPTLPGANTCQTVYAVAEKAADLIKADAKSEKRAREVRRHL